jgi:hypothetical protein
MSIPIAFNSNILFTGAPVSELELIATGIHKVAEAATSCGIPFFNQNIWIDPDSILLQGELAKVRKLFRVADTFLGAAGPYANENGFYLLRGPLDVIALARMHRIELPSEFTETCSRLLQRVQLLVFQLPDPESWRWQGFDQKHISWFTSYTKMLFEAAREHGLKLEQLRVLPPQSGDSNGCLSEMSWRIFGIRLNALKLADRTKPLASAMRDYETQCREIFERRNGSVFGVPLLA